MKSPTPSVNCAVEEWLWARVGIMALILTLPIASGVWAGEQKLWVDQTADFSPNISQWPEEVVPIYPGAEPTKCFRESDPNCGPNPGINYPSDRREINLGYTLKVGGATAQEIADWYRIQLLANHWILQPESGKSLSRYDKCYGPDGVISLSLDTLPMGGYPQAPTLILLILDKYAPGYGGSSRCQDTVNDGFPGDKTVPASSLPSESTKLCSLSGEPAEEVLRIKSEIESGFKVKVCESDLCGAGIKAPPSSAAAPWHPDGLKAMESTLELLNQSCFLQSSGLNSICKAGSQEKEMCNFSNFSGYVSPVDHKVVFCYDRWSIKDQKKTENEFYGEGVELLQQLLVHEIGHVYWRNPDGSLNFDKVSSWLLGAGYLDCTTMLGCLGVVGGGFATPTAEAPTAYAATSPAEDFAESVRFYVTQPDKLKERSWLRYRYLKDNVFCGYEYGSN